METAVGQSIHDALGAAHYRSLFMSDLHLGHFASRADRIIRFLRNHHAEVYYLVGDILDLWIPKTPVWSCEQAAVIAHLRQRFYEGAKLVYVRGNHDRSPEDAPVAARLPVEAVDSVIHEAADGRKYWVVHGDAHDTSMFNTRGFNVAGHKISSALAFVEGRVRKTMRLRSRKHDATTNYVVSSFYQLIHPKFTYQTGLSMEAAQRGLDGVICGHFHQPDLLQFGNMTYANCGDWIQNFTALAEGHDGRLHLLQPGNRYRIQSIFTMAETAICA